MVKQAFMRTYRSDTNNGRGVLQPCDSHVMEYAHRGHVIVKHCTNRAVRQCEIQAWLGDS